jgi:hypothetical protein
MKITNKQKIEIDFFSQQVGYNGIKFIPTEEEIEEYINRTVYGKKKIINNIYDEKNRLFLSKRILDIQIKDWIRDMREGILFYQDLLEGFNSHPYILKIIETIKNKRMKDEY